MKDIAQAIKVGLSQPVERRPTTGLTKNTAKSNGKSGPGFIAPN